MKPLEFDLNEPPPFDNQVREAGQPCIHHVPMAPAERSLQPQVYPSRGPIEVVELDSDDEDEDNHEDEGGDDDDDDGEDDDYDEEEDDDGDDDIGDEEEDDNDDGYSYDVGYDDEDVSSGQISKQYLSFARLVAH
ncbi:phosphopantothenoylcysteine decarboxylase subunit VHS3-like [Helianthus annuus]|uniref:phosphopantothenoylcysteine decarboxylase subunit VHS3-like n=1 Tax=Helianthus annuus TaxID=4232 RepID=UPI001652D73F|nr:phosphopantothenoylcysteine decarboxylase subunit VHS3-like [Helianthus annuus]